MTHTKAVLVTAVALVAAGLVAVAPSAGASVAAAHPNDAFYVAPKGFGHAAPGTILRSRKITLSPFAEMPQRKAWQLLYRSTDQNGKPMAAVTTVIAPSGTPKGILSYQIATDSSNPKCAPSHQMNDYEDVLNSVNLSQQVSSISGAVSKGLVVSVPDYEGPHANFGAPRQPGYAILDGLRAAERFAPLGLNKATPAVIWGYSGGSLVSGWAAQLQHTYAPDVNVKGVAVGGWATNVYTNLVNVNGTISGGLLASGLPGILRGSPRFAKLFDAVLKPSGRRLLATSNKQCALANIAQFLGLNMSHYMTVPFKKFMSRPAVKQSLAPMTLGRQTPRVPLFVYHSIHDEVLYIKAADALVKRYCADGAAITYVRDNTAEHVTLDPLGAPAATAWLLARLHESVVPSGCTTTKVETIATYKPGTK
ncbi:MAG: hypothetical protein JWP74_874 [Marmoricola sp.]|nr:hypothetical protein [Marmoricola sp.]